ncbi:MAG: hypothetical protein JW795_19520 [Chitinivibrionales bacterium]|nr:hypothetical protein [Chitinivibrionales bacterium]
MQRNKTVNRIPAKAIVHGDHSPAKKTPGIAFASVTCPCCHHRFIDRNSSKKVYVYEENDPDQPPWEPEYAMKCKTCKSTLLLYNKASE